MPAPAFCTGIDEAGLGPLLGPLCIVAVSAYVDEACELTRRVRKARTGVRDSKQVHDPNDLAPLERMALAAIRWATGALPATAAEVFALLGEDAAAREHAPWMAAAADLPVPSAADKVPLWRIEGVEPRGVRGCLVHPARFNATSRAGVNKHDLELDCLRSLLKPLPAADVDHETVIDRLGGRRYYRDYLQTTWPDAMVLVEDEERPLVSAYRVEHGRCAHCVAFCVEGESVSVLTAMASCIAKYSRELHMLLLNRWWSARRPGLKPSAGYTTDARRWLRDIGDQEVTRWGERLVRRHVAEVAADDDAGAPPAAAAAAL